MPTVDARPPDRPPASPAADAADASGKLAFAIARIETEFSAFLPKVTRVDAACAEIRTRAGALTPEDCDALRRLPPLLGRRTGDIATSLFETLAAVAHVWPEPAELYRALLAAQDPVLRRRAVDEVASAVASGRVLATERLLTVLAEQVERPGSGLTDPAVLAVLDRVSDGLSPPRSTTDRPARDIRIGLLVEPRHPALQRLAARLLDLRGEPPTDDMVATMLGREAAVLLGPYLEYTRATYLDLVDLLPVATARANVDGFRSAERVCGKLTLASALAELGWARVNDGIEARRLVGVSLAGAFPFVCRPEEARLFDGLAEARRVFDRIVLVAAGRAADTGADAASPVADAVTRFRASSVVHAELLSQILDIAPLTRERLHTLVDGVGRLVEDFRALFARPGEQSLIDEAAGIERVYTDLLRRIDAEAAAADDDPLPMSVCRLVQPFEDPTSPSAVRTLHGLKRYLHQRGLKLAFSLIGAGPSTGRSIDLAVGTSHRDIEVIRRIEFVDLASDHADAQTDGVPYAVSLAAEAFAAHAVHGRRQFPHLQVFCYGNEVHYFVTFRNHPAFIRVDFSPPLRGGMIDLQYLGVSAYDLSHHPNLALDAARRFFEHLDFIVDIDTTRVHARYDKERAVTIEDLHRRVRQLLHLVPYLMDLDWVIGGLDLKAEAKMEVAETWARFFERWGVVPYEQMLTADRRGVLISQEDAPDGVRETRWDGRSPYRDRFCVPVPPRAPAVVAENIARAGIDLPAPVTPETMAGQVRLDDAVLDPLRAALGRGEVEAAPSGLHRRSAAMFEGIHEVERLAEILESPPAVLTDAARLASLVPLVERHARFETAGSINGYPVQRTLLALGPVTLRLFCLRDSLDMPRLAVAADANALRRRRDLPGAPWVDPDWWSAERVARALRRANLLGAALEPATADEPAAAGRLRSMWRVPHTASRRRIDADERVVNGTAAAPGRAAGTAKLGTSGRAPADVAGAILMAPALASTDAPLLWQAAGVVSTGGGILSHLGLIAVESGKPALIIEGAWGPLPNGEAAVTVRRELHDERAYERSGLQLIEHHHIRYVEDQVREGDLVIVDADEGTFAVFGQDPVTLAFHEALRQHAAAIARLHEDGAESTLINRGHLLRARHLLERAASRVGSPALARYGVREILTSAAVCGDVSAADAAMLLLRVLLDNPQTGPAARAAIRDVTRSLAGAVRGARQEAVARLRSCATAHDALALRLNVLRPHGMLRCIAQGLDRAGLEGDVVASGDQDDLDDLVRSRLAAMRSGLAATGGETTRGPGWASRLAVVRAVDDVLQTPAEERTATERLWAERQALVSAAASRFATALVVTPRDGGLELEAMAGGKAANLAEASSIVGAEMVPGWFALTTEALRVALESGLVRRDEPGAADSDARTLGEAISTVASRQDLDPAARAAEIRDLWTRAQFSEPLVDAIRRSYSALGDSVPVAVRSSALGEDTAETSQAGLFDTFLFVRGEQDVIRHVKLAWAGFWSERAWQDRRTRGDTNRPRGGLVVQRMVRSRVAGVAQTINAAESRPGELVINVGLGLGEGIVSGRVAADHVVVAKDPPGSATLRFRYLTADKRRRVVLDERFGSGTITVETLAHQRLRPALEYPELGAVVDLALRLEQAYAHPVDIEFAFEDAALCLLQVRPVPGAAAVWGATLGTYPFGPRAPLQEGRP